MLFEVEGARVAKTKVLNERCHGDGGAVEEEDVGGDKALMGEE